MNQMSKVEKKLAHSLTADSIELIPYLPYLLQDLWELGSSPTDIIHLIKKHIHIDKDTRVLDLACGKGAVSIHIAKAFGCQVKGIDIMPNFIKTAQQKAIDYHVESLCYFVIEDINQSIKHEETFDIVVFGAAGSVLGNQNDTLKKLSKKVRSNGYLILDDAYANTVDDSTYITKKTWLKYMHQNGFTLIEDLPCNEEALNDVLSDQMTALSQRVHELKEKYPQKGYLFEQYLESQKQECDDLTNHVTGVTMLLQKK